MPSSPAMRISPGRELRTENHKRGRSLESGILFREKDDDLALFNEVQNKERENFLLQSNDDFDDLFSTKLRYFSDHKLGISVPARGESSDLLNAEGDKNDYDWLITPPETPLFHTLDDEAPPVSAAPRGRTRTQPISISRSSTMEKGYRSSRGSASPQGIRGSPSPHRLSPSPRSGNSPLQSISRPFSATHSSPPRHSPPSRRLSPPPSKPSPAPRSNTPTPRRMSTGSATSSRTRGTSPMKTSRGNSASPKIKAWQSNIPGFSSEVPPNLRTSLADRPASYVRGSSPASRNSSRSGRQSMSPTPSRSVSSSHSHERDQFISYSKGSVASSGDDDVDSLLSNPISSSDRSVPRGVSDFPSNRSKKPAKALSNSAPKRSFDVALRQMERKGPQNMFRPLLSSVPSSTFYAGKASGHHRSLTSRNSSSITTSSNASSDQGTSGALDTEENQEDVTSEFVKGQYQIVHDEVFAMDEVDVAPNEAVQRTIIEESPGFQRGQNHDSSAVLSQLTGMTMDSADVVLDRKDNHSDGDGTRDMETCSKCSLKFHLSELVREGDLWHCLECNSLEVSSTTITPEKSFMVDMNNTGDSFQIMECVSLEVSDRSSAPESLQVSYNDHLDSIANDDQHSDIEPNKDIAISLAEEGPPLFASRQNIGQSVVGDTGHKQFQLPGIGSDSKIDVSDGMGISLLLKRSTSGKGHLIQSRSFTASNSSYDDFSYVRGSMNSMRSSIGQSSASVSSSVDLGSSRQTELHIHRQSSGQKSEMENYRYEMPTKHKRSISSLSGGSGHVYQIPIVVPSCLGDSFDNKDTEVGRVKSVNSHEKSVASECTEAESTCTDDVHSGLLSILTSEEPSLFENGDNLTNNSFISMNEEALLRTCAQEEDVTQSSCIDRVDVAEILHRRSLDAISEMEIVNGDIVYVESQSEFDFTDSKGRMNELLEPSVSEACNDVMTTAVEELDTIPVDGVLEESPLVRENHGQTVSRSLTLEEATDTILFCSSIVHNLAYEAANMAIDKENSSMEALRPVTFVGKSNSDRRDIRSSTLGKRSTKSQKARQRKLEMDIKPQSVVAESEEKPTQYTAKSPSKGDSMHPPKLESKCNCTIM